MTFARCGGRPDTVTLTTLHSSKGLEYEVVIMPGLEEGRIPGYAAKSAGALAEASAGVLRRHDSCEGLRSTCCTQAGTKTVMTGYGQNGPSRFVHELQASVPPST